MIRKRAVSVILLVALVLAVVLSLPAIHISSSSSGPVGIHANSVLADGNPTATPTLEGTDSNPSGGDGGG